MDCKYDSSSEQSLDHHQIIISSAPYQILVLYNVVHVKMILLLNNHQIISSLSDLWGCFTMCMDCKSDSSLEQYSDHHQIIRSSAPCQNCGDLEGLLSGTWRLLGCCTIHMIQVPSSDLWRLFGALHKYIIQCFITDSW